MITNIRFTVRFECELFSYGTQEETTLVCTFTEGLNDDPFFLKDYDISL